MGVENSLIFLTCSNSLMELQEPVSCQNNRKDRPFILKCNRIPQMINCPRCSQMFILLTLFSILLASNAYCGLNEGVSAFEKGDYKTAYEQFKPSAGRGDASAQCYLGYMYEHGLGVRKDHSEAARWFRKAENQGFTPDNEASGKTVSR